MHYSAVTSVVIDYCSFIESKSTFEYGAQYLALFPSHLYERGEPQWQRLC